MERPKLSFGTQIDRYLAKLIFVPLLATLVLAAMLLLLEKMLRLFDFVVTAGGPVNVVWRMLADLVPEYLGLGIPIGLMLGILLAFRKLALSSELDALRAVGIGYSRLLVVPYVFALALLALNFFIVGFVQPYAQYSYAGLRYELRSGALGASIKVGDFTNIGRRITLRVERSEKDGTELYGVFLRSESHSGQTIAVTADRGTFLATDDPDVILFRLANGRLVHNQPDFRAPRVLRFTQYDFPVNLPAIEAFRGRGNGIEELTLPELVRVSRSAAPPERIAATRANFHFRVVEIVMMLLLPLLAVALAIPPKRSSSGLGIFLAIVFVVTLHKINQYAEHMGALGRVDPLIAAWLPFVVYVALVGWMYWTIAFKPGGQPIGALERGFSWLGKWIGRLARRGDRHRGVPVAA
jgi:lipopolysaccharide export system permease protein